MAEVKDDTFKFLKDLLAGHLQVPFNVSVKFVFFIAALVFVYITNNLDIERKIRRIYDLTAEIKELRYEHITTQSELMNMSKQSEVLRRTEAENLELKELTDPPRVVHK